MPTTAHDLVLTDLRHVLSDLILRIRDSPESVEKAHQRMTSAEASKLRGLLSWLGRDLRWEAVSRCCVCIDRASIGTINLHFALTPALQQSLEVLPLALKHVPERSIHIFP